MRNTYWVEWTFNTQHWQEVKKEVTTRSWILCHQSNTEVIAEVIVDIGHKNVQLSVTALYPQLGMAFLFPIHSSLVSKFDRFVSNKVPPPPPHTHTHFSKCSALVADPHLPSPQLLMCVWVCDVLAVCLHPHPRRIPFRIFQEGRICHALSSIAIHAYSSHS